MSDQGNAEGQEPNADASTEGQESEGNQEQGQEPGSQQQGQEFDPSTITDPVVKAYLEKVQADAAEARKEAGKYRTERNGLKSKVTEMERAGETEAEKATRERQERDERLERLERENRDLKVGAVVQADATKAKAHNPARVWSLLQDKVETDDDGKPTNVAALIADLKKSDPYLFQRTSGDAGDGKGEGSQPTTDMNQQLRRMTGRA